MKWYALIALIILCHSRLLAQKTIDLEVGLGHNTMTWETEYDQSLGINDTTFKRKELFITPSLRITYKFSGWRLYEKVQLNLVTFIGYSAFGGKSASYENGYKDKLVFNVIEAGAFPQFDFNEKIVIGPVVKGQYIFSAKLKSFGSVVDPPGTVRKWGTHDVDGFYRDFSMGAGCAVRYNIKLISVGAEAWFGLMNLAKEESEFFELKVRENNYRFMIGIKL